MPAVIRFSANQLTRFGNCVIHVCDARSVEQHFAVGNSLPIKMLWAVWFLLPLGTPSLFFKDLAVGLATAETLFSCVS